MKMKTREITYRYLVQFKSKDRLVWDTITIYPTLKEAEKYSNVFKSGYGKKRILKLMTKTTEEVMRHKKE